MNTRDEDKQLVIERLEMIARDMAREAAHHQRMVRAGQIMEVMAILFVALALWYK